VKCWNCGTENDLDAAQTCARCGAPLIKTHAFFRKPWLLFILAAGLLLQALFMSRVCGLRGH
jgi:hypothetical protein